MGENNRKRIGLIFNFNPKWMGGVVYLLNIGKVLNFLDDNDKPHLLIFYPKQLEKIVDEIQYPYLEKIEWVFPSVIKGFIWSLLTRKNIFVHRLIDQYNLNGVYPMHNYPIKSNQKAKQVSWYADLQHKYYPHFFTKKKRIERDIRINYILKNSEDLVVSSKAVKDDFEKFFKIPKTLHFHIYQFVSVIDELPNVSGAEIKKKYALPKSYFMISNQFHKHKNHKVALLALAELKKEGREIHMAITGRLPSNPNSDYLKELHEIIARYDLAQNITFLGLLPRGDQLLLMKNSEAIIQPSLFEGWSTVIEDARSLEVPVVASNLPVNIEQLGDKGSFFSAHDYSELALLIKEQLAKTKEKPIYEPYNERMRKAAYSFYSIFSN